jgi:glycosyltransferase involved in cell wall biosynthesis
LDTFICSFRYAVTIIRQDGLAYFFKRFFQFTSWKIGTFYQSIHSKAAANESSRLYKVDDIQINSQLSPDLSPGTLPSYQYLQYLEQLSTTTIRGYRDNLVFQGISAHNQHISERKALLRQGHEGYSNRRILFVSPIRVLGGGANLIFLAANSMRRMGVDAQIMNLNVHRSWFERNYPNLSIPVLFVDIEDIPRMALNYDAVIATSNPTVSWIAPAVAERPTLVNGYYIQDYEPYFYSPDSHEFHKANASYTLIPNQIRMVTTPWISDQIERHHHVQSHIIGGHMDTDLFIPRSRTDPSWPDRPLRIVAMIRPATARRNPKMTMAILQQASNMYQSRLEIILFGCDHTDPGFASLEKDFSWQIAGQLLSTQIAHLFNEADIFVDYSDFQAFGLTALESMASGLVVIVPSHGGTNVYAKHEENCLVVDTHDQTASFHELQRLIEDDELRLKLQHNAVSTAARFFPELPAFNMLKVLFPEDK